MTVQEANRDALGRCKMRGCNLCDAYRKEVEQYRALGTVEELKEAREKQVAKKLKIQKTDDKALFKCPCCDNVLLEEFYGVVTLRHGQITKYCEKCGQAIDESEME